LHFSAESCPWLSTAIGALISKQLDLPRRFTMNRTSSRIVSFLAVAALAVAMSASAFTQTASAQEKLSQSQINTLVTAAKTPAEHQRIADYYKAEAQNDLAQAGEHQAMIAAYKANPSSKHQASAVAHCANLATSYKEAATKSQQLAQMHQQMATQSGAQN
jgi:hypothetical protein